MPTILGYLRHQCAGGQSPFAVMGNVAAKGSEIGWGIMMMPNGPDPSQFGWLFCPWCGEGLPQTVAEWQNKDGKDGWSPFGIKRNEQAEGG